MGSTDKQKEISDTLITNNLTSTTYKIEVNYKKLSKILKKVSTYAKQEQISTTEVYNRIRNKEIEFVVIDGIKFVKIK